jgi:phosphoribosylamine--glycine ligase
VNEDGIFPLEFTARFGFPALQLQSTLSVSPFEEFLKAVGDGRQYDFKYHQGYGVVVLVAVPPFPYDIDLGADSLCGMKISFKERLSDEEMNRINFEDVSRDTQGNYHLAEENGFALHVSGYGETVEAARKQAYELIKKISIPKMFYRTDIGLKYIEEDRAKLKKWGYV